MAQNALFALLVRYFEC